MTAEKALAQVAELERLLADRRAAWKLYAATLDDPDALIASPEYHAYAEASEAWDLATDGDEFFKEPMLALKRAAVEWVVEFRSLDVADGPDLAQIDSFLEKQRRLAELALVVLEVAR